MERDIIFSLLAGYSFTCAGIQFLKILANDHSVDIPKEKSFGEYFVNRWRREVGNDFKLSAVGSLVFAVTYIGARLLKDWLLP